jgi:hypothetical protein
MSLVIMNEQLSNELAHTVLEKLTDKLLNCINKHFDGIDQSETISQICTEISNVARQVKPKNATIHEVNF